MLLTAEPALSSASAPSSMPSSLQWVERWVFVDISSALSFSEAQRQLTGFFKLLQNTFRNQALPAPAALAIDCGSLVLTGKMLNKVLDMARQQGWDVGMLYARLPQTQQAALSCGLGVKEWPPTPSSQPQLPPPESLSMRAETLQANTEVPPSEPTSPAPSTTSEWVSEPLAQPPSFTPLPLVSLGGTPPVAQASSLAVTPQPTQPASPTVFPQVPPEVPPADLASEWLAAPSASHYLATLETLPDDDNASIAQTLPTRLVVGTLRSGQTIVSEGHLVVIGDVHSGSEVVAKGHVVVWGELRGVAHAGAALTPQDSPQPWASIRALLLRAVQLRIGATIARRPDRITNHKPDSPLDRSWCPEVARMINGEIRIQADQHPGQE
ncbi:MAG: septum site-determining protein MinC [Vampirovibrionales bacterium]